MINVVTALGNPIVNNELNKIENINVLLNDLQYKEAIIEFLEKNIKINYLIISETLPGEIEIEKIINNVKMKNKNIKIILIRERKFDKEKNNKEIKNVDYTFFNNEVDITDIIEIINNKKMLNDEKIKEDIEILKEIVINKNKKAIKNIKINELNKIKKENKIITVLGSSGVGKSVFSIMLSKILKKEGKKNLIIDFDILNNNIYTILGTKKYPENINYKIIENNYYNIQDFIIKINNNIDLISGLDLLFPTDKKIDCEEIINKIKEIKNDYDYIIIDTSSECFFEYNKNLILMSDIALFLTEANLLEIKKARKLLDIYEKEWNIEKEKIKIIINKYNSNSIKDSILIKLFYGQEIIGKIKMSDYYNYIINKNHKLNIEEKKIKNEYIKLSEKILKVNFKNNNNKIKNIYNNFSNNILLFKNNKSKINN